MGGTENLKPFKPGQSGNPGGRPKGLAAKVRELAPPADLVGYYVAIWSCDEEALSRLGISRREVSLADRTKAGDWLADRGYGKAPAYAPVEGDALELDAIDRHIESVLDDLAARRETKTASAGAAGAVADTSQG